MNKVNELVLCTEDYANEDVFRTKLSEAIMLLLGAGYICTVKEDVVGVIVINYEYADQSYGHPYPYWLTPEQWDSIPIGGEEE